MSRFNDPAVERWFETNTYFEAALPVEQLPMAKAGSGLTVGVCLPALNEEDTVGPICASIVSELEAPGLVDRVVVIDSGSTDRTAARAREAGAEVFKASDLVPTAPPISNPGKGESLWKSLAVLDTDIVVWIDSDTRNFVPGFVTNLVAPLIVDPQLVFTKAFYDRPLHAGDEILPMGGARVTEIGIRPLVNLLCPALAGFIQPLSGEFAGRRDALLDIPFATGYDVDLLMLMSLAELHGLEKLAQVDLGSRLHRNRDVPALGRMSFEIVRAFLTRLDDSGHLKVAGELPHLLTQFTDQDGRRDLRTYESASEVRSPMRTYLEH